MRSYNELEALVITWAHQKGILDKGTPYAQCKKTLEEVVELEEAIAINNREEIIDALGDILVTIIIQAEMQKLDLLECLESAYNVISKRKGVMVDGQFVKDATNHGGFTSGETTTNVNPYNAGPVSFDHYFSKEDEV